VTDDKSPIFDRGDNSGGSWIVLGCRTSVGPSHGASNLEITITSTYGKAPRP
jgi:hypothetical protein